MNRKRKKINKDNSLREIKLKKEIPEVISELTHEGEIKFKRLSNVERGRSAREKGILFELKVRSDLERKGWIVSRWKNNVDLDNGKLASAKNKWSPFSRWIYTGGGFPDFVVFRRMKSNYYKLWGVESRTNGRLKGIEKEKCKWLLENKIFQKILVASEADGEVIYREFKVKV